MIFGPHGVVFHGVDARDAQKCVALENHAENVLKLIKIVKNSRQNIFWELKNEMLGIV